METNGYELFIERIAIIAEQCKLVEDFWVPLDPLARKHQPRDWSKYRFSDCIAVLSQEANRVLDLVRGVPQKELQSKSSVSKLEQQYGLWRPYDSEEEDESEDEDYKEEEAYETDENEMQEDTEEEVSDEDVILLEEQRKNKWEPPLKTRLIVL